MTKLTFSIDKGVLIKLQEKFKNVEASLTSDQAAALGRGVVERMKELIASGTSPIAGKGKFPAYKTPLKYPGLKKPHSPVNLKLSGDFLNDLAAKAIKIGKGFAIRLNYFTPKEALKEKGHRDGSRGQRKRPTLPQGAEEFESSIDKLLSSAVDEGLEKFFK